MFVNMENNYLPNQTVRQQGRMPVGCGVLLSDIFTCQLQCNTRILCKFIMFETLLIYSTAHLLHHITIN